MKTRGRWCPFLRVILTVTAVSTWWGVGKADPQINLLNKGCSQYNASNIPDFVNNLNATFADLRTQLSSAGGSTRFSTSRRARSSDPVYAMAQCRNYLSGPDCLACYDAAVAQIRNFSARNGARVIYDGCFLSCERLEATSNMLLQWERCNAMVMSWIMNAVSKEILRGIVYSIDAVTVWNDLKERFDIVNGSRIFSIHRDIGRLVQGNTTVTVYYSKLRQLWDEYASLVFLSRCDCDSARKYLEHN